MYNIEANIEYFAFVNRCNRTFSQIEIIIKFLENVVKEGLNYVKDFPTVNVKYCGFFLAQQKHPQKTRVTCETFETKYVNTTEI